MLGLLQLLLGFARVTGMRDGLASCHDQKLLQAHINSGLTSSRRQRLVGHLGTGEAHIPTIRLFATRDRLGHSFQGSTPARRHTADLREHQKTVVYSGTVAILLIGETI